MKAFLAILLLTLLLTASALKRNRLMNHLEESEAATPSDPEADAAAQRMMTFMFSDPEILASAMTMSDDPNAPLPPALMTKMINFLLDDPYFSKMMLQGMEQAEGNEWMTNLSDEKKKKVFKITLEELSKDPSFNPMSGEKTMENLKPSNAATSAMMDRLINDDDQIAEALLTSTLGTTFSDPDTVTGLKTLNPDWKDWDFANLDLSQKRQIFEKMKSIAEPAAAHRRFMNFKHASLRKYLTA